MSLENVPWNYPRPPFQAEKYLPALAGKLPPPSCFRSSPGGGEWQKAALVRAWSPLPPLPPPQWCFPLQPCLLFAESSPGWLALPRLQEPSLLSTDHLNPPQGRQQGRLPGLLSGLPRKKSPRIVNGAPSGPRGLCMFSRHPDFETLGPSSWGNGLGLFRTTLPGSPSPSLCPPS